MSIYIKGMQTPVAGQCIEFAEDQNGDLYARLSPGFDDWHEVVSLPAHGRLVDADRLAVIAYTGTEGRPDTFDAGVEWAAEQIDKLPTVIPKEDQA